jgi:hypothetical protein
MVYTKYNNGDFSEDNIIWLWYVPFIWEFKFLHRPHYKYSSDTSLHMDDMSWETLNRISWNMILGSFTNFNIFNQANSLWHEYMVCCYATARYTCAVDKHRTIYELLEAAFVMLSAPRLYNKGQQDKVGSCRHELVDSQQFETWVSCEIVPRW